jgi:alpha-L-fucosidase
MEMGALVHFGMNTFTDREWGDGKEDPKLFNPSELNAKQWASALKAAGIKQLVFTAKHHDGFCLWPSAYTEHSVKNSPWREGKGDVVREVADACRAGGLKLGIYLSPWDRHESSYGDSPKYNEFFLNQLRELLTHYGPVSEVWFDGACGEGPRGKRQKYDWAAYYKLIRELQPQALIAIAGPDIRWAGNEQGVARENESSIVSVGTDARKKMMFGEKPSVWWPAECDVSIRPGWFYHKAGDGRVKSLEQLMDIYYKSVGRNAVLQLNVAPDKRGLIHENDVKRLAEFGVEIQRRFGQSVAETSGTGKELTLTLSRLTPIDHVIVMEDIRQSERVNEFVVEGLTTNSWQEVSKGQVIGHKRILQFPSTEVSQMRLRITKSVAEPIIRRFAIFNTTTK